MMSVIQSVKCMVLGVLPALSVQPAYGPLLTQMSAQEQLAFLATPQRAGSNSLPAFAQFPVSEVDHLVWGFGDEISRAIRVWLWQMPTQ